MKGGDGRSKRGGGEELIPLPSYSYPVWLSGCSLAILKSVGPGLFEKNPRDLVILSSHPGFPSISRGASEDKTACEQQKGKDPSDTQPESTVIP